MMREIMRINASDADVGHRPLILTATINTDPKKLLLSGDIESNPGPTNYQSHRAAVGGFCNTCKRLSLRSEGESL